MTNLFSCMHEFYGHTCLQPTLARFENLLDCRDIIEVLVEHSCLSKKIRNLDDFVHFFNIFFELTNIGK